MLRPDKNGYYGMYGGAFVPEMLYPNLMELQQQYEKIIADEEFQRTYQALLRDYVGRPTPLYHAKNLSAYYGCEIYLKREDLCHTGAHKINNAIGQVLLAKYMGKRKVIAETGAGQHGVATATACALLQMPCEVFMGAVDVERQKPNVLRMQMLGATVTPVYSGTQTLKDATNEALKRWIQDPIETFYVIGSVVGPHPYPDLVTQLQAVISQEIKAQMEGLPDAILACIGGGSNAMGAFYHFIPHEQVALYGAEAAGKGIETTHHAASLTQGSPGVLHGAYSLLLQSPDGQVTEPYSLSAGLDYPGVGPAHAFLFTSKRSQIFPVTDEEALQAAFFLAQKEGILPALETAHAIALLNKIPFNKNQRIIINLSGRGDKDLNTYSQHFTNQIVNLNKV